MLANRRTEHAWTTHILGRANAASQQLVARSVMSGVPIAQPILMPLPKVRKSAIPDLVGADFPTDVPRKVHCMAPGWN